MFSLFGGVFLGWSLGANDAANIFGAAVTSRMLRFWTAALLAASFVMLGAITSGRAGIETLTGLTQFSLGQAAVASSAAALTVAVMTLLGLPVSSNQAMVGAILGIGILNQQMNLYGLGKVLICWFGTPIGSAMISVLCYLLIAKLYNKMDLTIFKSDILLRWCLIIAGIYGSYALGANSTASVAAVFVGAGLIDTFSATLIGGASIALGIVTLSRPVMETVGRKLVRLDAFSAFIVSLSMALTVHFYTFIGVPVSTSQAVVGSVLGVGIVKGANTISRQTLKHILVGWFLTPTIACFLALGLTLLTHFKYVH